MLARRFVNRVPASATLMRPQQAMMMMPANSTRAYCDAAAVVGEENGTGTASTPTVGEAPLPVYTVHQITVTDAEKLSLLGLKGQIDAAAQDSTSAIFKNEELERSMFEKDAASSDSVEGSALLMKVADSICRTSTSVGIKRSILEENGVNVQELSRLLVENSTKPTDVKGEEPLSTMPMYLQPKLFINAEVLLPWTLAFFKRVVLPHIPAFHAENVTAIHVKLGWDTFMTPGEFQKYLRPFELLGLVELSVEQLGSGFGSDVTTAVPRVTRGAASGNMAAITEVKVLAGSPLHLPERYTGKHNKNRGEYKGKPNDKQKLLEKLVQMEMLDGELLKAFPDATESKSMLRERHHHLTTATPQVSSPSSPSSSSGALKNAVPDADGYLLHKGHSPSSNKAKEKTRKPLFPSSRAVLDIIARDMTFMDMALKIATKARKVAKKKSSTSTNMKQFLTMLKVFLETGTVEQIDKNTKKRRKAAKTLGFEKEFEKVVALRKLILTNTIKHKQRGDQVEALRHQILATAKVQVLITAITKGYATTTAIEADNMRRIDDVIKAMERRREALGEARLSVHEDERKLMMVEPPIIVHGKVVDAAQFTSS